MVTSAASYNKHYRGVVNVMSASSTILQLNHSCCQSKAYMHMYTDSRIQSVFFFISVKR